MPRDIWWPQGEVRVLLDEVPLYKRNSPKAQTADLDRLESKTIQNKHYGDSAVYPLQGYLTYKNPPSP